MPPLRHRLGLIVRASVTIALIAVVATGIDVDALTERLTGLHVGWALAALAVLFTQAFLAAGRGAYVLAAIAGPVPLATVVRLFFVGQFFGQTLPSSIGGDVVRIWLLHKAGVPFQPAANAVLIDRVTALVATVLFVTMSAAVLDGIVTDPAVRIGIALALLSGIAAVAVLLVMDCLPWPPARWRVVAIARTLSADARRVLLSPVPAAITVGSSLVIVALTGVVVYLLGLALDVRAGVVETLVLMPIVLLATLVPVSLAGWGVREVAMIAAFAFVGMVATDALALSILFGLALMLLGVPGGMLWLVSPGRGPAPGRAGSPWAEER